MTKKGVLFDMDGTLINAYENINFRQALSELKTVQKTLILKILKSRICNFAEMEIRTLQEVGDPTEGKELVCRVSDSLLEHYDNAPLKKNAPMFPQYAKQKNYKIYLYASNVIEIVSHILREKHMKTHFDYMITSQQVTRFKPDPQMYLEVLRNVDLTAEECIAFKDTENGVMAARNVGTGMIVVNDKGERKHNDVLMTIHDFGDYRLYQEF